MEQQNQDAPVSDEFSADLANLDRMVGDAPGQQAPGVEAKPAEQTIPTAELIKPIMALACSALVPAWEISQAEQDQLTAAYAAVVDKHFPDGVPMGPETAAILVTAAVVMPRLGRPMRTAPRLVEEGAPVSAQSVNAENR